MTLSHLSLFSGIGGIDLAAEACGFRTVAFCESEPFCQKVLNKNWPGVPVHNDVRSLNGEEYRGVDLVSCGFPCQDVSVAGSQKGLGTEEDPTRTGLWFSALRIIRESRPAFVLGENVPGLFNKGLDSVICGLRGAGYEVGVFRLGVWNVGGPHERNRLFIVGERLPDADRMRESQPEGSKRDQRGRSGDGGREELENSNCAGSSPFINTRTDQESPINTISSSGRAEMGAGACGKVAISEYGRCQRRDAATRDEGAKTALPSGQDSSGVELADPAGIGRAEQWESGAGSAQMSAVEFLRWRGIKSGLGGAAHGLSSWLDGGLTFPAGRDEDQYGWEAPRLVAGRVQNRRARVRALGNAVCPWQVFPILAAIAERARGRA